MADFENASAYDIVTLVDRTTKGGCEIIHDGKRIVFKPGQVEKAVPQFIAEWLFGAERHMVHTTDGQYVHRFAVRDAPEELLAQIGAERADESPIEVDTTRTEGWNTELYADDRGKTRTIELRRNPADFANQGEAVGTLRR